MAARRTTLPLNSYWPICGNGGVIRLQVAPWLHSLQDESSSASVIQSLVTPQWCLLLNMYHWATSASFDCSNYLFIYLIYIFLHAIEMMMIKYWLESKGNPIVWLNLLCLHFHMLHIWSYLGQSVQTKMIPAVNLQLHVELSWLQCAWKNYPRRRVTVLKWVLDT